MEQKPSSLGYIFLALLLSFISLFFSVFVLKVVSLYLNLESAWGIYIKISIQTIFMFGIPPIILRTFGVKPPVFGKLSEISPVQKRIFILGLISWVLSVIPVQMLSYLNSMIHFPDRWSEIEKILRTLQETSEQFLHQLLSTEGVIHFYILTVVIAVIPAIFEEFFFRGCLQSLIINYTGKVWSSIVISSLVFSMYHGEFYSILPRLFLGIVLGMAYYSSRKLWIPVILHFLNNFASLVAYRIFATSDLDVLWLIWGKFFGFISAVILIIAVIVILRRMKEIASN